MYELLFGESPRSESRPDEFHPSAAELSFAVAAPGGQIGRLSVLTGADLCDDLASVMLSEGLSALALAPIRVFPLAGPVPEGKRVQARGPEGASVLTYSNEWATEMPHPPPAAGAGIEVELAAPVGLESGIVALDGEVAGSIIVEGLRTPGAFFASPKRLLFVPTGGRAVVAGPRCRFRGEFIAAGEKKWVLAAAPVGSIVGESTRGQATWIASADRVGLRVEIESATREAETATVPPEATATLETGTLSVDSRQIEAVVDDATVLLRRPE